MSLIWLALAAPAGAQTVVPSDPVAPPVPPVSEPDCTAQPFLCEDGKPKEDPQPAPNPNVQPECQPQVNDTLTPLLPECSRVDTSPKPEFCDTSPNAALLFPECATPNGMSVPAAHECDSDGAGRLGACSPMCQDARHLNARTDRACRLSGSIARPYPLSNYGLDVNADFDISHPENLVLGALQELVALAWQIFLHFMDGVLLLLEWAFSLDLLGNSDVMKRLHDGLTTFHERVLGPSWTLAALSLAALWGLWYGLVRGKTIETIAGLGGTVALMILALLVIYRPDATVAPLANLANQGSMQVVSGVSQGTIDDPNQHFASSQQGLFDAVILRPWCALQFGDVDYCLNQRRDIGGAQPRPKRPGESSIADAWLQFESGSASRRAIFQMTSGEEPDISATSFMEFVKGIPADIAEGSVTGQGPLERVQEEANGVVGPIADAIKRVDGVVWRDPDKVELQTAGGVFDRFALLAIVLVGLVGAMLLFGWLAVRLLLASLFSLMYILMAPVLLLVAACGNAGRASVVAAAKRGLGQIIAKFVYAFLLALVLLEANILASLQLGFYATWLLQIAFWWGFFLKRHDFLGFLTLDERAPLSGGLGLSSAGGRSGFSFLNFYYGARMAKNVVGAATRAATAAPRAGIRALRRAHLDRADADSAAVREQARGELALRARREAQIAHDERLAEPRRIVALDDQRRRRLAQLNDEVAENPGDRAALQARDALAKTVERDKRNVKAAKNRIERAGKPRELTERDVDQWIERRRRDVMGRPADAEENLRAAKIRPSAFANAGKDEQDAMRARSARFMERDRQLMDRIGDPRNPGPGQAPLSRDERREAFRESVPQGTFGDLSERARAIRQETRARDRFERQRDRVRPRSRRRVR